ncbi:hypothetical protein NDU88_007010 [Pleurodeles waltl]|uniref:Uncharacterized protein n=1 Tax=Pleurodeles waltl TaxID=8319 RepID=A0AAV7U079_PLEWA|nr:hypothetical protein NDU88_007010 [Pleurodeles waltl]
METKGGVTRSRDSKDFFEEKQLVTLRPNTRWRAIAEHANLLRLMPRTDVHWVRHLPKIHADFHFGAATTEKARPPKSAGL